MMNCKILLCSCLLFTSYLLSGQSALNDAIQLTKCLVPKDQRGDQSLYALRGADGELSKKQCYSILWKYTSGESGAILSDEYDGNPYISTFDNPVVFFPDNNQTLPGDFKMTYASINSDRGTGGPPPGGSSGGGLSVNAIADGLAKFIAKRMKEELTLAFFDKFKRALEDQKEIGDLFPRTKSLLLLIDKEIYHFDNYITVLRESFILDLQLLPDRAVTWFDNHDFVKDPSRRMLIRDAIQVGRRFIDGTNPIALIHFLGTEASIQDTSRLAAIRVKEPEKAKRFKELAASLRLVDLISSSIVKDSVNAEWYSPEEVVSSLKDPATFYLYMGLLYQQSGQVGKIGNKSLANYLAPLAEQTSEAFTLVQDVKSEIRQIAEQGKRIKTAVEELKKVNWDTVGVAVFHQALQGLFDILASGSTIQSALLPDNQETAQNILDKVFVQQFVDMLQHLNEMRLNVRRHEYVLAVNNLSMLVNLVTEKDSKSYLAKLIKYSNFIANVAEAENSDQVAELIEAFALPPGGSRLKKQSKFSVSINSYGGAGYGNEWLQVQRQVEEDNIWAMTAPVGIGVNFGIGTKENFAVSTYFSVVDVGALTAFRLGDDEADNLPELEWSNIIAPGGHLVLAFTKSIPLAIGAGVQRGPNLRKVTATDLTVSNVSGWRLLFFASVDIPLFHLYTN